MSSSRSASPAPFSAPVKASEVVLDASMSVPDAFAAISHATLGHMRANEQGALETDDPEYIHQMRVALRRLRSAVSLFPPVQNKDAPRKEMKRLAAVLGEARDWDVLVEETLREIEGPLYGTPLREEARDEIARLCLAARKKVQRTLKSSRYRALIGELSALTLEDAERDLTAYAREALNQRYAAVQKRGRKIEDATAEELHRLRIAVKKLRYTVEFLGSLFDVHAVKAFRAKLMRLQQVLGVLNDAATTRALAQSAFGDASSVELVEARGTLIGWSNGRLHTLRQDLRRHWKAFEETRTFW